MTFLLDTSIASDLIRRPSGPAAQRLAQVGERNVALSIVVACELRFGAVKKGSADLTRRIEGLLARIAVAPLTAPVDGRYAAVRQRLERAGTPIGANDLLIAAHALAPGRTLVTDNVREFARVPDLSVENWLDDVSA